MQHPIELSGNPNIKNRVYVSNVSQHDGVGIVFLSKTDETSSVGHHMQHYLCLCVLGRMHHSCYNNYKLSSDQ